MFFKIGAFKNFALFAGKYLTWSLFFRCFPVNIASFLRTVFLQKVFGKYAANLQEKTHAEVWKMWKMRNLTEFQKIYTFPSFPSHLFRKLFTSV